MADLVNRKSVIDVIHKTIFDFFDIVDDDDESPMTYKDEQLLTLNKAIVTKIKALPSADVQLVRHGKWFPKNSTFKNRWLCSVCGYTWYFDTAEANYCSRCGARMDGEQDE